MGFMIFKILLLTFSAIATALSLIFMLSTDLFRRIEEFLGWEFGAGDTYVTILEGRINFVSDWIYRNHVVFGPILAVLAALNTRNVFLL
jgi:hypothetical protein